MKRTFVGTLFICLFALIACQHELGFDKHSSGSLAKDASGNCLPVDVGGNFVSKKITNDSNFLTVHVDVNDEGDYLITSDNVNGYSFKASGTFNSTGNIAIELACTGAPLLPGLNHFNIKYNDSFCEAFITVKPDTIAVANYTLQGSPGNCMDDSIVGYYIQSVPLDTSNKIFVKVNVITPGTYSITTNPVNGYSFSASGIFISTGIQTVRLSGAGVPVIRGNNLFRVTAGSGICSLSVTVAPVVPVVNQNYFPLTEGSNWTYTVDAAGSTTTRSIKGDTIINNLKYARMIEIAPFKTSSYFFNQNIYDYTEFGRTDKYTSSFVFGSDVNGLLPFLKEHLAMGQSWESEEFRGVASFGQVLFVKYLYKCVNNNTAITVNGQGFINVYNIVVYPMIRSENNSYGSTGEIYNCYYAKGVGLVYMNKIVRDFITQEMQLKSWHVN